MNIAELLQEFTPSRSQFSQVLSDTRIRMGFECEMVVPTHEYREHAEPEEPPDYDSMTWDEAAEHLYIDDRTQRRINEVFDEWLTKQRAADWMRVGDAVILRWCIDHDYLKSADDPNAAAIMQKHRNDAYHNWRGDHLDQFNETHTMDDFINNEYGTITRFLTDFKIDHANEVEDDYDDGSGDVDIHEVHVNVAARLRRALGVPVAVSDENLDDADSPTYDSIDGDRVPAVWRIEQDESIVGDEGVGAEVVSGVYQLSDGLEMLRKTFAWMDNSDYQTNRSTGLHVSFSIKGLSRGNDYDFLKMMILFDENYTADLFKRLGGTYCKQMRDVLFRDMREQDPTSIMASRNFAQIIATLRQIGQSLTSRLGQEKYYSFRHRENGVVEFRSMGGADYQNKFDVIRNRIINMAYIMLVGADPNLMQRDYLTRIYRMLIGIKYEDPERKKNTGTTPIPPALSTFASAFESAQGKQWLQPLLATGDANKIVAGLAQTIDGLTPPQARQLRVYVIRNRVSPERVRQAIGHDPEYNRIANVLRWPLVVPGHHDSNQPVLPFARSGTDLSGVPLTPREAPERPDRRQMNLGGREWGRSYNPNAE